MILVHSALKGTGIEAESFIKRLLFDYGTVLFPCFNFGFAHGEPFNLGETPSKMGTLSEIARKREDVVLTGHPMYSFAVIGDEKHLFENIDNYSGYGADSPFAYLKSFDGEIMVVNLDDQHSMTFYHHVEEMNEIPYRFHKKFSGLYNGKQKEYGLFVRKQGIKTSVNRMGEFLKKQGLYKIRGNIRTIKAVDIYDATEHIIKSGQAKEYLYES